MNFHFAGESTEIPDDVQRMLALLAAPHRTSEPEARTLFDGCTQVVVTRAPGRLDVMGGIADYSGARVLEWPIAQAVVCAAALAPDNELRIVSLGSERGHRAASCQVPMNALVPAEGPQPYAHVKALFQRDSERSWAAYVAGAFVVLAHEKQTVLPRGARILLASDVPEGRGLSSSAALEVAALKAVATLAQVELSGEECARLAQIVENHVVGAPCGLMDQMTSSCGEAGRLMAMVCQPAVIEPSITVAPELAVWGLDSAVRHHVGGADYTSVRVAAFMGYRMLAAAAGLPAYARGAGRVHIDDRLWNGYLANVTPAQWHEFGAALPEVLEGDRFLADFGGITDNVTHVQGARSYPVRAATWHPIAEQARVTKMAAALRAGMPSHEDLVELGQLMYAAHESYGACGLGCPQTDLLIDLVKAKGPGRGLFGAKITGGGSGGTVAVLGLASAYREVVEVAHAYTQRTGLPAQMIAGSSVGAHAFGHLRSRPVA